MKLKKGYKLKEIDGVNIIVCDSNEKNDFNSLISLTDVSAFLWHQLESGEKSKEQLLNSLLDNFEISTVLALNNIDVFLKILYQYDIIDKQ